MSLLWAGPARADDAAALTAAQTLYRTGMLANGQPVQGEREGGAGVQGASAACVNCHRRSGLGSAEGRIVFPPIIGKYLFRPLYKNAQDLNMPHVASFTGHRQPYTDDTLKRAIRDGVGPSGEPLNYLMPRYKLDDAALQGMVDYLKQLTSLPTPGVSDTTLQFATIITPDADPRTRDAMVAVMQKFFAVKNALIGGAGRPMQTARPVMYRVERRWELHVWQLTGSADTWEQQLDAHLAAEPVFAVLSGLGGKNWAPVHRFCERREVPCLFPNVELPVHDASDFYSVYFSRGVLLEAQLMADRIGAAAPSHVLQIYRTADIGEAAAKALQTQLGAAVHVTDQAVPADAPASAVAAALREAQAGSTVVLWLRPADVAALPAQPPPGVQVLMSGRMGGLEHAPLPAAWRAATVMAYPFDLPDLRRFRMNFPLTWFRLQQLPVVDEQVQSDTYLACGILAEALSEMLDSFVRDYLVERLEDMLSHRQLTGYYPRLGLGPTQRFASKGGYFVKFAAQTGDKVEPVGEWVVP
ncbi:MAG: cytochrome C [Betaproteobacteria bacterium]|nr:cytochrome C [Betaproteobacteria bacterium]